MKYGVSTIVVMVRVCADYDNTFQSNCKISYILLLIDIYAVHIYLCFE